MTSDPDLNHVKHALRQTEFMVLQEIFPSETAQYADVVLPAASWAEKEGTFTNTERRIQRVRKAVPAPGEAKLDSWIVTQLAKRMMALGAAAPDPDAPWADWEYERPQDVMAEINALTPIYAGVTYERLDAGAQLQWPVRAKDHPGTPVLHVEQFSRGLGRFVAAEHIAPAEMPDEEYPLMLTTGRVIYHWHGAEMTRRASGLNKVYPEALIEVSPKDAQRAGVRRRRPDQAGIAPGRDRCEGAGDDPGRGGPRVRHVPLPRFSRELSDQSRARPDREDTRVQGVRGEDDERAGVSLG